MTHILRVREVHRWTALNEYEGELSGVLDGLPVDCYFLGANEQEWAVVTPGAEVTVDAKLVRLGDVVQILPCGTSPALEQEHGSTYVIAGVVERREGGDLFVNAVLPLHVDLDVVPGLALPTIEVGDVVRVRGVLTVQLPD